MNGKRRIAIAERGRNRQEKALCRSRLAGLRQRPDVGGPPEGEPAVGGYVAGGRVAVAGPLE